MNKQLTKAIEDYDKVCEKLESLNEQAFSLEQEIWRLKAEENKEKK